MKRIQNTMKSCRPTLRNNRLTGMSNPMPANGIEGISLLQEPAPPPKNLISAEEARSLGDSWRNDLRWRGVTRTYTAEKVLRLRGTLKIEHTIADKMSRKPLPLCRSDPLSMR